MIRVTYHIHTTDAIGERARAVALEQSLEVPETLVRAHGLESSVGDVVSICKLDGGSNEVVISYPQALAENQLPQFLNLVFGNVLIQPGTRVVDIELPESELSFLPGPGFGVEGVRHKLAARDRPLLATALKPRGLSNEVYGRMAHDFVCGGGDLIKDDHNIVDGSLDAFLQRVSLIHSRVGDACATKGTRALYAPYVSRPDEELDRCFEELRDIGIEAILVAPFLLGLDRLRALAVKKRFVILSHPTFSGSYYVGSREGVDHGVVLGSLVRWCGADISIFPHAGGRFCFSPGDCARIAERLRRQEARAEGQEIRASFPAPAGGMTPERFEELGVFYGPDTVYLIGGALLEHSNDLTTSTRHFRNELERSCLGRRGQDS